MSVKDLKALTVRWEEAKRKAGEDKKSPEKMTAVVEQSMVVVVECRQGARERGCAEHKDEVWHCAQVRRAH